MTPVPIAVGAEPPPMHSANEADGKAVTPSKASKPKGTAKGRFALLNAYVDFTMCELSRAEHMVWMVLYRDSREGIARTAQTDIARRGKIDRRTVGRSLQRLAARGLIEIVYQGGFRQGVSRYRLHALMADPRGT